MAMPHSRDPGVPLAHFRQHGAAVLFCCPCGRSKTVPLEAVIKAAGETTGIRAVAALATRPCDCGRMAWETRPDFPSGSWSHGP
jgi:hypothetical protein